jgi:Ca-activated chloride channel homolog
VPPNSANSRDHRQLFGLLVAMTAVACLLFCIAPTIAQQQTLPPPQTIHVDVARVNVGVIVVDAKGKFVEGLRREDFHVFDNASAQPITEFSPIEEPGQVLLLIEAGPAVYLLQDAHLLAADALLRGLSPSDRIAIVRYAEAPEAILDFIADKQLAQGTLDQIQFNLGFGQLNLSSSLNTVLDWVSRVPGKKTIVLLSTGVDTSSPAAIQALQTRLQLGDVRVLCVSMSGPLRNGKEGGKRIVQQAQQAFANADAQLKAVADATGGRAYFPENAKAFQETYREVAQLVRHEYSVAFTPPTADGAVHSIDVKVDSLNASGKDPAYQVSHRRAYQAPKTPENP